MFKTQPPPSEVGSPNNNNNNNNWETASAAPSTISNFSAGFKAHFEWLFLPTTSNLSQDDWNQKENDISECLAGSSNDDDQQVDLWQLRELALTKGGLLCPDLRKRAWPKLLAAHETVLQRANDAVHATFVNPSRDDVLALKYDVSKTIWNVEDHLVASQQQRKIQQEKLDAFLEELKRQRKRVSFAAVPTVLQSPQPADVTNNNNNTNDKSTPPAAIVTSPSSQEESQDDPSVLSNDDDNDDDDDMGTFSPSENTVLTQETSFTLSSRVVRWRKASIQEQKILFNIMLSILRTEAAPSEYFSDDRYHYYRGLQDLTALFVINLESPSLTSLVLTKLSPTHLRDALRNDKTVLDTAIYLCFMPLLEMVDSSLHAHLMNVGMTMPSFCRQWIACWFAQDVPDVQVASRLMDVFLVSHPLMPIYVAVALLVQSRETLWNCDPSLAALYTVLRGLPMRYLTETDDRMVRVENIIATALSFM